MWIYNMSALSWQLAMSCKLQLHGSDLSATRPMLPSKQLGNDVVVQLYAVAHSRTAAIYILEDFFT
jgi:hypothetical protein